MNWKKKYGIRLRPGEIKDSTGFQLFYMGINRMAQIDKKLAFYRNPEKCLKIWQQQGNRTKNSEVPSDPTVFSYLSGQDRLLRRQKIPHPVQRAILIS